MSGMSNEPQNRDDHEAPPIAHASTKVHARTSSRTDTNGGGLLDSVFFPGFFSRNFENSKKIFSRNSITFPGILRIPRNIFPRFDHFSRDFENSKKSKNPGKMDTHSGGKHCCLTPGSGAAKVLLDWCCITNTLLTAAVLSNNNNYKINTNSNQKPNTFLMLIWHVSKSIRGWTSSLWQGPRIRVVHNSFHCTLGNACALLLLYLPASC